MDVAVFVDAIVQRDPTLSREAIDREFAEATLAVLRAMLGEGAPVETNLFEGVLEASLLVKVRAVVSDPQTEVPLSQLSQISDFSDCQDGDELLFAITYKTLTTNQWPHREYWSELEYSLGKAWFGAFDREALRDRMEEAHKKILVRYLPHIKRHQNKDLFSLQRYLGK